MSMQTTVHKAFAPVSEDKDLEEIDRMIDQIADIQNEYLEDMGCDPFDYIFINEEIKRITFLAATGSYVERINQPPVDKMLGKNNFFGLIKPRISERKIEKLLKVKGLGPKYRNLLEELAVG